MKGIDYGYGYPGAALIKKSGYDFVCRYLSHSPGKNLSAKELAELRAENIAIVVVWETTTNRPLSGYDAGVEDATSAVNQLTALGIGDVVIYFACDEDFSIGALKGNIAEYFKGVNSVIGVGRTGVYGGLNAVTTMFDEGLVKYGWQTYAWSHHKWDSRAQLRQIYNYGPTLNGVQCDTDESVQDDFGQFN